LHLRFDRHGPFGEVGRSRFDSGPSIAVRTIWAINFRRERCQPSRVADEVESLSTDSLSTESLRIITPRTF
jgi:hypothetical protein